MTSHDVVAAIRRAAGEKRVGHAGTLDPMATGLLIVGIGRESTKKLSGFLKQDKTYEGVIRLGAISTTDDAEGILTDQFCRPPSKEAVIQVLKKFSGEIEQLPPAYSAIKIKGQKAYKLARKGKQPKLQARQVVIHNLRLIDYQFPDIRFEAAVSSGTYIRSLARDIGQALGCGGYLIELKRTRIGNISLAQARELSDIIRK